MHTLELVTRDRAHELVRQRHRAQTKCFALRLALCLAIELRQPSARALDGRDEGRSVYGDGTRVPNGLIERGCVVARLRLLEQQGGTEVGVMPTSSNPQMAWHYARLDEPGNSVLLKIIAENAWDRGAPLEWISAFPGEKEFCYPPLTYLQLVARKQGRARWRREVDVLEVKPTYISSGC